jgi:DNA-binding transcriptional LysR family regulator
LAKPSDLLGLPLLHEESTQQWERWFTAVGVSEVPLLRGPRLWHAQLAIEAACLGQGIALANSFLVEEDLRTGRLVEIVPSDVRLGGYYLVAQAKHWEDASIKTLRHWLKSIFGEQKTDAFDASMSTNS